MGKDYYLSQVSSLFGLPHSRRHCHQQPDRDTMQKCSGRTSSPTSYSVHCPYPGTSQKCCKFLVLRVESWWLCYTFVVLGIVIVGAVVLNDDGWLGHILSIVLAIADSPQCKLHFTSDEYWRLYCHIPTVLLCNLSLPAAQFQLHFPIHLVMTTGRGNSAKGNRTIEIGNDNILELKNKTRPYPCPTRCAL